MAIKGFGMLRLVHAMILLLSSSPPKPSSPLPFRLTLLASNSVSDNTSQEAPGTGAFTLLVLMGTL